MHKISIRTYLLLLVLGLIVPLVAIVGYSIYSDMQQTIENTKKSLRTLTSTMVRNTGSNIVGARQILASLAERPLVKKLDAQNCDGILPSLLGLNKLYANVVYLDMNGRVVCSALPQPSGKPVEVGGSQWFLALKKTQKFTVGEPFMGPITGKRVSVISAPILGDHHEMIGAVALPVDLSFYDPNIPTEFISNESRYGFFSNNGVLVWRNADPQNSIGTSPKSGAATQIVAIRSGEFEETGLDGIKRYYSVAPMDDVHWSAYVGVPSSEIYAAAQRRAFTTASFSLAAIFILLLFAIVIAKRITRPIEELKSMAVAIHQGDTVLRASTDGPLEIASVARALNTMIESQQDTEARLKASQKIAHLGAFDWNLTTGEVQWSDEHFRLWGFEPRSIVPSDASFRGVIHPDDIAKYDRDLEKALHEKSNFESEFRIVWKDGSEHFIHSLGKLTFDAAGIPICMIGTAQDVSERKQAESELQASEQRFRYMLESCPTAARIASKGGRNVIFYNARYTALLNVVSGQAASVDPMNYYADKAVYNDILSRLARGDEIFEQLVELNIPGAGTKWALASYLHFQYQGESAVMGWFHDVTKSIQLEKLKGEFVSTVSHELRTPLTAISGALGLLAGGAVGEITDSAKKMIEIAHKNSQRLTLLINDLLDIDKLVAGKVALDFQEQALMPLIEQALEGIRAYGAQYQVTFKLIAREDVLVRVDGTRLIQILNNFLSNAAKFSPQGGQVEIAVSRHLSTIRVEVIDHGPGLKNDFRDRVFQRFSQADSSDTRQKGGTGLGLAISKELIERMNGRVGFDSEEGKGACFYFELPLDS
jgi:PAS domain S-box-containing protein